MAKESQITTRLSKDGQTTKKKCACKALLVRNCELHPLMHTLPPKTLTQDGGEGQKGTECALKYEICSAILFFFLLPLIAEVVVPSGRPYCFRVELLLNGFILKKVSIAGSPSSRGISMTITSLIFRFRCRPPISTTFAPNRHCSSSR